MKINQSTRLAFTFTITGKCNCDCAYCHFYAKKDRVVYNRNLDDKLFDRYVEFIKFIQKKVQSVLCRFSGGEPLVMGDNLFDFSNKLFERTGIEPHILTNGKLLSTSVLEKAKNSHIQSFIISFENPFDIDRSSVPTDETIDKYRELQNDEIPLNLGMVVVKNQYFKDIGKICDYFYKKIGQIPPLCEVNFTPYKSPTDEEFNDLYTNIKYVVKKYHDISDFSMFPYVVPEYCCANLNDMNYLVPLPIDDKYDALNKSNEELLSIIEKQIDTLNFPYDCDRLDCEWRDACKRVSAHWKMSNNTVSAEQKMKDYCKFKKTISNAFFDALSETEDKHE